MIDLDETALLLHEILEGIEEAVAITRIDAAGEQRDRQEDHLLSVFPGQIPDRKHDLERDLARIGKGTAISLDLGDPLGSNDVQYLGTDQDAERIGDVIGTRLCFLFRKAA